MSMSGLSAQLAHINSSSRASSGTTITASRRADDAVGRGISHSARHGHSLRGTSSKDFPSVLFANQKVRHCNWCELFYIVVLIQKLTFSKLMFIL